MKLVEESAPLPADFWAYFDALNKTDLGGHDLGQGDIELAYREPAGRFDHLLLRSRTPDVFLVMIVDRASGSVFGHHLLDLPHLYGRT